MNSKQFSGNTPPPRNSCRGSLRKNLLAFLLSLILCILLVELGLRFVDSGRFRVYIPAGERSVFWHYDPLLGWKHLPNQEGPFTSPYFDTYVKINSRGFRGRMYPYHRPKGVFRIAVLGDSFTWGFGVEQEEIFTEILERSEQNLEVINMGVSGYSTDQEYLLYREEGWKYEPNLVLVMFYANDLDGNVTDVEYLIYPKPLFSVVNGRLNLVSRPSPEVDLVRKVNYYLRTHLVVYNTLAAVLTSSESQPIRLFREMASRITSWVTGKNRDDPFEVTFAILSEMNALTKARGTRLAVVKIATHVKAQEFDRDGIDELAEFCRSEAIPFLDLALPFQEYLRSYGNRSLRIDEREAHWNAAAHRLAAENIYTFLKSTGLIGLELK